MLYYFYFNLRIKRALRLKDGLKLMKNIKYHYTFLVYTGNTINNINKKKTKTKRKILFLLLVFVLQWKPLWVHSLQRLFVTISLF